MCQTSRPVLDRRSPPVPSRRRLHGVVLAAVVAMGATCAGAAAEGPSPQASLRLVVHPRVPAILVQLFAGAGGVRAVLRDVGSLETLQTLDADDAEAARTPHVWIEDLNFDGYLDLALPTWAGATGTTGAAVVLFDPARGRFERDELVREPR